MKGKNLFSAGQINPSDKYKENYDRIFRNKEDKKETSNK